MLTISTYLSTDYSLGFPVECPILDLPRKLEGKYQGTQRGRSHIEGHTVDAGKEPGVAGTDLLQQIDELVSSQPLEHSEVRKLGGVQSMGESHGSGHRGHRMRAVWSLF